MHIFVIGRFEPVLGNQIKSVTVEYGIAGKNKITRQITGIHDCLEELVPAMDIKHIRQLYLQRVEPLHTQFIVNSTTAVKVCAAEQLVSVLQSRSFKSVSNNHADNILGAHH